MEYILQQIAFGVKCSEHAEELVADLAGRMNQAGLKKMVALLSSKIRDEVTQVEQKIEEALSTPVEEAPAEIPAAAPAESV